MNAQFTASEANYTGTISAVSSNTAAVTVSGSGNGPGPVTFTLTSVAPGNANVTVSDDHSGQQVVFASVTTGTMMVNPQILSFDGPHGNHKFKATDSSATASTIFSAVTSDPTIVTVNPLTQTGKGPFDFTVIPAGGTGQATITVSDANGTAVVSVGVGVPPLQKALIVQPPPKHPIAVTPRPSPQPNPAPTLPARLALSSTNLTIVGSAQTQMLTVTETGYSGPISAMVVGLPAVEIDHPSGPGPTQIFKLTSRTVSSTTIRVSDNRGNAVLVSIQVTTGGPTSSPIPSPVPTPPPPSPRPTTPPIPKPPRPH